MKNEEELKLVKFSFINKTNTAFPQMQFLLPELENLQLFESENQLANFEDIYNQISTEMTVHDAGLALGKCIRDFSTPSNNRNSPLNFLESLHLFIDIEAKIRFSLWKHGINAPHHFSKMCMTAKVQNVLPQADILCILAILADPKGLNLRNIVTHGFSFDTSLSLPLLRGISSKVYPKLPSYEPPIFNFKQELNLLYFHSFRLNIHNEIDKHQFDINQFTIFTNPDNNYFPLLDVDRLAALHFAQELYNNNRFVDSLLILFPILEHSIRRAAVAILDLPIKRLCASPDEHFLSIQESLEAFPESHKNMAFDLLFLPNGPRIRDRIMHGAIPEIPQEFAFCIFALFEKCNQYYTTTENENNEFQWTYAFHPSRCLEYEIMLACFPNSDDTSNELIIHQLRYEVDLLKLYNSQTFERLIECVAILHEIHNSWKDQSLHDMFESLRFNRFICACVLFFVTINIKNGTLQHLNGLVHSIIKFESTNDIPRFKKTCETRVKAMKNYLPFIPNESNCSYTEIESWINNTTLLQQAINSIVSKINA